MPKPPGSPESPFRAGFVALVGKPNTGKSTLLNVYLGQKIAIVSPRPQTTRTVIRGALTFRDAQIIFLDTPGIHQPVHRLGAAMVEMAGRAVVDADVVVWVADLTAPPDAADQAVAKLLREKAAVPLLLALNKADAVDDAEAAGRPYSDLLRAPDGQPLYAAAVTLSATARPDRGPGAGRQALLEAILRCLPESPPYYPDDFLTDQPLRAIAAELVREQVMRLTHNEIPHAVAVLVDEFKERSEEMTYIAATIYVEHPSQKGILLGREGRMVKKVGRAARREIEALVGTRVYLDLWVKVRKNWRKDSQALRWLGYEVDG